MSECRPRADFLRHIFNTTIVEKTAERIAHNAVIEEIKKRMARAEDLFKFSIYGGDPRRLVDFLESEEWRDIVMYARSTETLWILEEALRRLRDEYSASCPEVALKAGEALSRIASAPESRYVSVEKHEITLDFLARKLKLEGIQAEIVVDSHGARYIQVTRPLLTAKIEVSEGVIKYEICRAGKTGSVEGLITALRKYERL